MTDVPARGAISQCAVDPTGIDTMSQPLEVVSNTVKLVERHLNTEGVRGSRSRHEGRTRSVEKRVTGTVICEPTATELDWFLPYILGGTTSGGVTDVGDTLTEFLMAQDLVTKVNTWSGLRVARAVLSGSAGQAIRLALDLEGETESVGAAGSFPSLTFPEDNYFVFPDLTLTLEASARKFGSFSLTIDNLLDTERFNNSATRAEISSMDRRVQLSVSAPYTSDNEDLKDAAIAGAAGTLVMTDGTDTYTFAFGNCKIPSVGPEMGGRSEILLPLTVDCYHDGTNSECKVTKT